MGSIVMQRELYKGTLEGESDCGWSGYTSYMIVEIGVVKGATATAAH